MDTSSFTTSLNLVELSTLNEVQSILAPNAQEIRARLIKLDVLGKDGVLKAQPVKPKDKNAFGTFVVSLPTIFQGGDLLVKSDSGAARRFEWSHNPDQLLQWAAYNSTCKYEALPVTAGYRATLTYALENPNGAANLSRSSPGGVRSSYSLEDQLLEAFKNPEFAPNDAKLGFALTHNGVVENDNDIPVLKGSDRMLKTCLDRLGLKYQFIPVLQDAQYHGVPLENEMRKRKFEGYNENEIERLDRCLARRKEWEFEDLTASERDGFWRGDIVDELMVSSWENYVADVIDYASDEVVDKLDTYELGLRRAREVVWIAPPRKFPFEKIGAAWGNEPSIERYYASACFIVWVPPSTQRLSPNTRQE